MYKKNQILEKSYLLILENHFFLYKKSIFFLYQELELLISIILFYIRKYLKNIKTAPHSCGNTPCILAALVDKAWQIDIYLFINESIIWSIFGHFYHVLFPNSILSCNKYDEPSYGSILNHTINALHM